MKRPTQHVFIIEEGTTYAFDAVIKLEAESSNKVAEELADVEGKTNVNYAILQPDTVQMEVSVSDTVTVSGEPLTSGSGLRSQKAFETMKAMVKRRNLLTVITPKSTYDRMLIENLLLEENEDYQNEAHMVVSFKEMIIQKKVDTSYTPIEEKPAEVETSQPSLLVGVKNWISSTISSIKSMVTNK